MQRYTLEIPIDIIDPSILLDGERFEYITEDIVPGVYPYYMVSNCGRVYHRYLRCIMKQGLETSGYLFITLATCNGPKIIQMNRLVLMVFNPVPNCHELQANHKDGNKLNNYLYNLEWVTRSENIIHAYENGLHIPKATISEDQAIQIVELLKTNLYQCKEIANIVGVNENIVNSIKKKESWKRLTRDCNFDARQGRLYSDDDARVLCEYFQSHPKPKGLESKAYVLEALIACGFDNPYDKVDTARKIYSKKHYTRISKDYNF